MLPRGHQDPQVGLVHAPPDVPREVPGPLGQQRVGSLEIGAERLGVVVAHPEPAHHQHPSSLEGGGFETGASAPSSTTDRPELTIVLNWTENRSHADRPRLCASSPPPCRAVRRWGWATSPTATGWRSRRRSTRWPTSPSGSPGRDVELLTTPGAEPHDFELTIKETAQVAGADLVVYERGFQPAVDAAVDETAEGAVLDAADVVDLKEAGGHEDDHEGHEHEEGADPHFWLDPLRMADLGDEVARQLSDIDPDHAEEYRTNAEDLRIDLERVDEEYADGLADCQRQTVVVSHDAFGYLEKYGLHFDAIAGLSPESEPTPAHLAELQQTLPRRRRHDGVHRDPGQPQDRRHARDDLGLDTRPSTRSRALTRRARTTTSLSCAPTSRTCRRPTDAERARAATYRSGSPAGRSPSAAGRSCARSTSRCAPGSSWR